MKNTRLVSALVVATAFMTALAGCGASGGSGDGDTITLRAATGLSDQHAWWEASMVPWMDRVEELTDGQVEFETFTSGELVEVPDEVEAIQNGTVDVSLILPIYQPDQFPMTEVTMLPISKSDTVTASKAWRNLVESDKKLSDGKTYYESQFGDKGIKAFPVSTTQEYAISTTGKEFDSVSAVKGMSLRTPSRIHEMYAKHVGIDSVTIPAVEMFDALSRGAFDGSFYSVADWSGYGFQDLFKYTLTDINFGHFNGLIGMTQSTWDDLPENVQKAMTQAHDEIFIPGAEEWVTRAEEMVGINTEEGGKFVSFNELDQPVQDLLVSGVEQTWLDYIKLLEDEDMPGKDVALLWRDLLVEEGGTVPDAIANLS